MADLTCGTCAFWAKDRSKAADVPDEKANLKRCAAVKYFGSYDDDASVQNERAIVVDGDDYFANLLTREDFGCVLHKNRA